MLEKIKAVVRDLYAREPARVNGFVVAALVAGAAAAGIVVAPGVVTTVVVIAVPLLVAELTRAKVVPEAKVIEPVGSTE